MLERKIEMESRDVDKQPMREAEQDALIGKRNDLQFLNARNRLYRQRKMKEKPPTRAEAIKLMAREPNLIRRPIVINWSQIILGLNEAAYRKL